MSSSNAIRVPISGPNIDAFTFGKSSLYSYDSLNHCLVIHSLNQINNLNDIPIHRLHLSSSPTWPIRRLILNKDESTLALLADSIVYLVDISKTIVHTNKDSPSIVRNQCPIVRVPTLAPSSSTITCALIDFVWLDAYHFALVYSIPSASECHIYAVRSLKPDGLSRIQTFSVGSSSSTKFGTPNKKISLHQPSDIIKLDVAKRKHNDYEFILLFAMKNDGDIFVLEIEQNQLSSNENRISTEFQGPIRILPSTYDNYGSDCGQSTFICLSNVTYPVVVFTRNRSELTQCIVLSPNPNTYYIFTIDSVCLPTKENGQIITSIIRDPFSSNKYYISDSASNVYLCELTWIDAIQKSLKKLSTTHVQHIINGTNENSRNTPKIEQMGFVQANNHGQYLAIIAKSQTDQEKELVLVRLTTSGISKNTQSLPQNSSDFVDHIRSLLVRDQSLPCVTLSTSSVNISSTDFTTNLSKLIKILNEQYIQKQDNVRKELEDKQGYLQDFQQTQLYESQELNERFQRIQTKYSILREQYQKELTRRKHLVSNNNDTLSIVEQATPVLSEAEKRLQRQLEDYDTQIASLKTGIQSIQDSFLSKQVEQAPDSLSVENIQGFVKNYRNQINEMQKTIQNIKNNN